MSNEQEFDGDGFDWLIGRRIVKVEDADAVKLQDYNTSDCDYYITEITLISGEHWYASMNSIGEIVFTGEPLLTHYKNMKKLRSCLEMNLAVKSFDFKVN